MKPKHPRTRRYLDSGIFNNLNRFSELEQRIKNLPETERGDAFEVFAEALLSTQKKYQAKKVWPETAIPPLLAKRLLFPVKDMGVDGVVETHSGDLIAYQVKFRSNRPALSWRELSTFVGLSEKADQRMVITNCDNLAEIVEHRPNLFSVRGNTLDRLETRDFRSIRSWLSSGEVKRKRKTPWPYQKVAIRDIRKQLAKADRTTAVMACASGKTLVSLWVAEAEEPKNVLVFLPSLALVSQIFDDWASETKWAKVAYMCVCSDQSVGKRDDSMTFDQTDLDFRVTTDSDEVEKFLRRCHNGTRVIFSTYQSSRVVAEAMPKGFKFDLGIFDEAHKTTGRGSKFTFALEDKNLPIRKRLFLTATPRHYDVSRRTEDGDASLVYSMDAEDVYGPRAHTLTFGEAVDKDIICDYKVLISVVTDEMVDAFTRRHGEVNVEGDLVKAQQVANQIALAKAVEEFGAQKIFTFHRTVNSAKSFSAESSEGVSTHLLEFNTAHVSGAMRTSKREALMKEFKSAPKAIISNARCLTEGVDVPAVDMVAFMSPKKSKVDIVQATGRAMRKAEGKVCGYVLVPLYLEEHAKEDVESALERTDFEEVWNVLQAMQEQDAELADIIRQLREDSGRTKGFDDSRLREKVKILGPAILLEQIRGAITTKLIDKIGVTWDERYGQLIAFKEDYGHCRVPNRWTENRVLSRWVNTQREFHKSGHLSAERVKRLNDVQFVWDPLSDFWDEIYQDLLEYRRIHGDCNVPFAWSKSPELGNWVGNQRQRYKRGQLSPDQIARLDGIGFAWEPIDAKWNEMFRDLQRFHGEFGHCNVPANDLENRHLYQWVRIQRVSFRKNKLSADRLKKLDSLNFTWDLLAEQWRRMYSALQEFHKQHGQCNVPANWKKQPTLLSWTENQRQAYKNGKLSQERIDKLLALDFEWHRHRGRWIRMLALLQDYRRRHGNCNVPARSDDYPELGMWVQNQRQKYKNGELSEDQVSQLTSLEFILDPAEQNWKLRFDNLIAYKNAFGHCNVPAVSDDFPELGRWVRTQRRSHKEKALSKEKAARLEAVGFQWDPFAARWEEKYQLLVNHKKTHGHCNVPQDFPENPLLGKWVSKQRTRKKQGGLPQDQERRLNDIGFVWNIVAKS